MTDHQVKGRKAEIILLFAGMAVLSAIFTIQGYTLDDLIARYALTDAVKGLPYTLGSAGGIAAFIAAFILNGRVSKRWLLAAGIALCCVFAALAASGCSFTVFCACWLMIGFGLGLMDALLSSCMADLYSGQAGTRMMCFLHTAYGFAAMLLPLIFSAAGAGLTACYLAVAAGALAVTVLLCADCSRKRVPVMLCTGEKRAPSLRDTLKVLKGAVLFYALAMLFHGFFLSGLNSWINRYVGVTLGSDLGEIALTFLFAGVLVSRFGFPFTGFRADRFACLGPAAAAAVFVVSLPFGNGVLTCICACVCALLFGAALPCIVDCACAQARSNTLAVTTLMMLSLYAGEALVSPVLGYTEQHGGLVWGMSLCCTAMALTGLCCLLALRTRNRMNGNGEE